MKEPTHDNAASVFAPLRPRLTGQCLDHLKSARQQRETYPADR